MGGSDGGYWLVTAWFGGGSTCDYDGSLTGCFLKNDGDMLSFLWSYALNDIERPTCKYCWVRVMSISHLYKWDTRSTGEYFTCWIRVMSMPYSYKWDIRSTVNIIGYVSCLCHI